MTNFFSDKKYKIVFFTLPLVILVCLFSIVYHSPYYIVNPNELPKSQVLKVHTSTDKEYNGNSELTVLENSSKKFSFKYTLKEGYIYRYAAAGFKFDSIMHTDLSAYDYIKIKVKSAKGQKLLMGLHYNDYALIDSGGNSLERLSLQMLDVNKNYSEHILYFKDMFTPDWWFAINKQLEDKRGTGMLTEVTETRLSSCNVIKPGIEDVIEIEEWAFCVDMKPYFYGSGLFLSCYFLIGWLVFRRNNSSRSLIVNYDIEGQLANEPILLYITSNYSNPDLDISIVQSETKISERQISSIIKKLTSLTFKQLLNGIRINESKRLLTNTNLNISEIAFKVGYSNVSHFNRVFKEVCGFSPSEYRKQPKNDAIV